MVVYVDIISCGVLPKIAEVNRVRDSAFISVYGPRDQPSKDLPGTEMIHQTEKVTKLVFFSGNGINENKNLRKLFLTLDTENCKYFWRFSTFRKFVLNSFLEPF